MNLGELTNLFTYHPPFGEQEVRYSISRDQARSLAIHIEKWCPRSREKSLAITKLQECVMMANASIAIHEVKPEVAPDDEDRAAEQAEKEEQWKAERDEQWKAERDEEAKAERDEEAAADEREQIEAEEQNL